MPSVKIYVEPDFEVSRFISSHLDFEPASIPDCDFILASRLPWGVTDPASIQNGLDALRHYAKPVAAFLVSDSCDEFEVPPNVTLFRTSLYKSEKHPNERVLPFIWISPIASKPLPAGTGRPIVGFCGQLIGDRASLLQALRTESRLQTDFIIRDSFWGGKPHDPQVIKEFNDNIKSSHFTVCSRGLGNFSMRFYEVLGAGRIPIVMDRNMEFPHESEIDWNSHIVRGGSNEEVIERIVEFWETMDVEKVQRECRKIYERNFTPSAFGKRVVESMTEKKPPLAATGP